MKKIINSVEQVENEMVLGMAKAYPQYVRKLDCGNVVVRAHKKEGKVALISGAGSRRICGRGNAGCGCLRRCFHFTDARPDF